MHDSQGEIVTTSDTRFQRRHLFIAAVLLVLELVLGIGIVGAFAIFIAIAVLVLRRTPQFAVRLRVAAVYACVCGLTVAWLAYNARVAQRRAIPIIAACRQFRVQHNRYPTQLSELIPGNLPALPNATYTLLGRHFGYDPTRPSLYFPAMYHGVFYYDFQTASWATND